MAPSPFPGLEVPGLVVAIGQRRTGIGPWPAASARRGTSLVSLNRGNFPNTQSEEECPPLDGDVVSVRTVLARRFWRSHHGPRWAREEGQNRVGWSQQ